MKAHDAGLKGTLTDNGDGTATFVMDELKDGETVSIGGKNYKIGSTDGEVDAWLTANDVSDAADKTVKINGTEYTYNAGVAAGTTTGAIKAGWYAKTPTAPADKNDSTTPDFADLAAIKDAINKGGTASKGAKSITGLNDTDAQKDGISNTDASVISREKAYELASKELLAANHIGDTKGTAAVANANKKADGSFKITTGSSDVADKLSFSLHVGSDADMTNKITVDIETMNSSYLGIKGLNVNDDSGIAATYAIDAISDALQKVSEQRSSLGAVQNRLEHTIDNLDNVVENTTTAESRIRDTDMAEEMVNYSKNNILAQAGQSMLAQANQSNQGVLSLLQ